MRDSMSDKQMLANALEKYAGTTTWGRAALAVIASPEVVFAGNRNPPASNTAGELLRIYRIKLDHCRERGMEAPGIVELIESLAGRAPSEVIEVRPFVGPQNSVATFWNATGDLVGCVTILRRDTESARQNLDFALGKK